jgi:micrococcal nuclease
MGAACCCGEPLRAANLDTPLFSLESRTFRAKCVKVYDGDTIHIVISIHGQLVRFKCRMAGYDSAELTSTDPSLKNAAMVARDVLALKINGKIIDVYCGKFDKYGRLLIVVYYNGQNINDWMIQKGHGTVYDGHGAKYGAVIAK